MGIPATSARPQVARRITTYPPTQCRTPRIPEKTGDFCTESRASSIARSAHMYPIPVGGRGGYRDSGGNLRSHIPAITGSQVSTPEESDIDSGAAMQLSSTWRRATAPPLPPPFRTPTPDDGDAISTTPPPRPPLTPPATAERLRHTPPPQPSHSTHARTFATWPPTPRELATVALRAHDGEAWLTIHGVTQARYDAYADRYDPGERLRGGGMDADVAGRLRAEYDPRTKDLAVKVMPTPVHDVVGEFFADQAGTTACIAGARRRRLRLGTHEYTDFHGIPGLAPSASKTPDFSMRAKDQAFPAFVVEVGWSEDMPKLAADANLFLMGSGGVTKVVVLVKLSEAFPPSYTVRDHGDAAAQMLQTDGGGAGMGIVPPATASPRTVKHSYAVAHLKHAMPAGFVPIAETTDKINEQSLKEYYLANKSRLTPPLVGKLSATALIFIKRDRAASIHDDIAPTAHPALAKLFPDIQCIREIPFLADDIPLAGAGTFSLPLSLIFPGDMPSASTPEAPGSDDENIVFDLSLLAAEILQELPQMDRYRAVKRAKTTMRAYRSRLASKAKHRRRRPSTHADDAGTINAETTPTAIHTTTLPIAGSSGNETIPIDITTSTHAPPQGVKRGKQREDVHGEDHLPVAWNIPLSASARRGNPHDEPTSTGRDGAISAGDDEELHYTAWKRRKVLACAGGSSSDIDDSDLAADIGYGDEQAEEELEGSVDGDYEDDGDDGDDYSGGTSSSEWKGEEEEEE
ncbi:hypothetical protein DFH27DRAFT_553322 [Peziza echinospora]|nr:hypothetical protein DFH27DRAFT_553322 [Peziza echinospora]